MRKGESLYNLGYSQPAIGLPGLWGNFNWILASPHYYDPEDCDDSLEPPHAIDGDGHGKDGAGSPGCRRDSIHQDGECRRGSLHPGFSGGETSGGAAGKP